MHQSIKASCNGSESNAKELSIGKMVYSILRYFASGAEKKGNFRNGIQKEFRQQGEWLEQGFQSSFFAAYHLVS